MISVQEISLDGDVGRIGLATNEITTSSQTLQIKTSLSEGETQNQPKVIREDSHDSSKYRQASVSNAKPAENILGQKLMAALIIDKDGSEVKNNDSSESKPISKGKNARKKRKKLKIPLENSTLVLNAEGILPDDTQSATPNKASVHEFFNQYSNPAYGSPNLRYLENLKHHPQFQYLPNVQNHINMQQTMQSLSIQPTIQSGVMSNAPMQTVQQMVQSSGIPQHVAGVHNSYGRQLSMQTNALQHSLQQRPHPASAPTTPLSMHQRPSMSSIQNSPNSGFFYNMMQHPLLNHSYVQNNYNTNMQILNTPVKGVRETPKSKSSPQHKNKKNETATEGKKFEPYMSSVELEEGLKNNTLIEGILRINPKQFQHAYISTSDRDEQDVFIEGLKCRNRALEGDIVVVQIIEASEETNKSEQNDEGLQVDKNESTSEQTDEKDEQKIDRGDQKRGKVVYIKEKVHTRTCIGNLKLMPDKNRQRALFIPRDHRIPRLNIPFTCWPDNFYQNAKKYENTLFLAKIQSWTDTRFAIGKILSNIGQSGNMKTETLAILAENDLDITPFGSEVRDLFPRLDYTIPEEEIQIREDCRSLCVFSIDPSNCRDIDDAISCRELSNGNYEIGVHISDVAHYLTEGTILDDRVAQKATTIYLVERAYHMLPDELCMLCSLFPGVDKLAFSVFWEITKDGKVLSHRFAKTVINSCAQLAYEHAQVVLENKDAESLFPETYNNFQYEDIRKSISIVGNIAAIFRRNRFENGALKIDQPKIAFQLSPANGLPESYSIYAIKESHQMIEEFMLLANMTVARRIYEDHPKLAFLRCHPPPSGFMLKQLAKALDPMGIVLDISSAGALHRSLLPHTDSANCDMGKAMVLNMLCAKPMTRAKYFCADTCDDDDFVHYALNIPIYTHFTSPIRRYADIMVHRLLAASLKFRETPTWEVDKVRAVAAQCNKQKYNAKKAGEMSSDLYMLKYIEMNSPILTDAVVVEVREKSIDVIVVAMGLNRRIFFNPDFPGEFNRVKHECGSTKMSKMEVTWRAEGNLPETKQVIEVFSMLKVLLHKADEIVKVETKIVRPQQ